ncbi:MAG: polysaccharide deacetylase family protein [Sphingorhabdus sp.]
MAVQGAAIHSNSASPQIAGMPFDTSPLGGPRFLVTVDTEEEFDWAGPFTRDQHSLSHVPAIDRFQKLCESYGIIPAYLVDWPIVQDPAAVQLLGECVSAKKASVGVQLHPWVNPPFDEEVSVRNSFACNLSGELERAKLTRLTKAIAEKFGTQPDIYRAGRYGAGAETPAILKDLGIRIDTSVRSRFNYAGQHGPDYSRKPVNPYWIDDNLIELPVTSVFTGGLRSAGDALFSRCFVSDTSRAVMSRAGLVERIALTPEGIPLDKAIAGIDRALEEGIPILNFSFHSPSLAVGHTPYVRDEDELELLYDWWKGVYAHLAMRSVSPVSVEQIAALVG